jgi:hypothetical protein
MLLLLLLLLLLQLLLLQLLLPLLLPPQRSRCVLKRHAFGFEAKGVLFPPTVRGAEGSAPSSSMYQFPVEEDSQAICTLHKGRSFNARAEEQDTSLAALQDRSRGERLRVAIATIRPTRLTLPRQSAHTVVSLTHRPHFTPQKHYFSLNVYGTHFC